jgi:hypothetical protein
MIAVVISQFFSALLFIFAEKWGSRKIVINPKALKNFLLSIFFAGVTTILIYSPVLSTFFANLGKVRFVNVSRMPFIFSLLNSLLPGIQTPAGIIVYSTLFISGIYYTFRKDPPLLLYVFVLSILPLSLYLLMNPMFVFERYFIFDLPFVLLIVSQGAVGLAGNFRGVYKNGVILFLLLILVYLQLPAINKMLHQDRQNYREAVRYVESKISDKKGDIVFSLGYAGEHFRYYSHSASIPTPESLDEFFAIIQGKKRIWCLITAWLPDLRQPHEDKALYSEKPGQIEVYNYVKKNFTLKKHFSSRYPVKVYFSTIHRRDHGGRRDE